MIETVKRHRGRTTWALLFGGLIVGLAWAFTAQDGDDDPWADF